MTVRTALFATALALGLAACGSQDPSPLGPETVASAGHASANAVTDDALRQALQDLPFRRILCFGDSLTFGVTSRDSLEKFSLSPVEGYIPKLIRLLRNEFEGTAQFTNSGIGAETTGQGLERLRSEIRSQRYDLVLLLEGVVDVNNPQPAFQQARANLKEMMRVVKTNSSRWTHETRPEHSRFAWQTGYAALSVSRSNAASVSRYIAEQEQHHRKRSFQEELILFLRKHGIEYDERYIWT